MTITENKKYKVLIPTAGTGSRLGNLTKYINKSLISVQNKPVISKIIEMFPLNTEFVIALGYKGNLVKQFLTLAYPDRIFYFVTVDKYEGEGSGLGHTILACEQYLKEPFVFCSCDTIVKEKIPFPKRNTIGICNRKNKTQYRTADIIRNKVSKLLDKGKHTENSKPYIGLACIKDFELFWQLMKNGKEEANRIGESYALSEFAKMGILFSKEFTWFDTGNIEELEKAQEYYNKKNTKNILPKENEAIWFFDDLVIKFFDNSNFVKNRMERTKYLKQFVPQIISHTNNMYCYKEEKGNVLSTIEDIEVFCKLLDFSKKMWKIKKLTKIENENFITICKEFYQRKTINRLKKYYEKFNIEDKKNIINGEEIPTLKSILNKVDWNNICNGIAGNFHGDFHFENILYNEENNKFIFLDWRQSFGEIIQYGDIYYDLAKLLHGLIICHELIAKNKYKIEISPDTINYSFKRKKILIECEKYFYQWLKDNNYDVKKVKILTALIYLNIAALHHEPYCHLLYNLGKKMLFDNVCINEI